ncbi:MAG: hypothetical protein PHT02_01030 [Tissierellia bacterium]|nr:hypothetical protein [Tissierellia bacterium]
MLNISKYKSCDIIEEIKCPHCREKQVRPTGKRNEKSYIECYSCFWGAWVNTKDVQITYEEPKETKKKKGKKENDEQGED